jgi:hypothetical protein
MLAILPWQRQRLENKATSESLEHNIAVASNVSEGALFLRLHFKERASIPSSTFRLLACSVWSLAKRLLKSSPALVQNP